jgi:hypothetical protein
MSCCAAYCPGARTFIPAPVHPPSGTPDHHRARPRSSPRAVRNSLARSGINLARCFVIADAVNRLFLSQGGTRRVAVERPRRPKDVYELVVIGGGPDGRHHRR